MTLLFMVVIGLMLGSFVNALVWRLHHNESLSKKSKKSPSRLSIVNGRSICPNCKHTLAAIDLIPVLSWVLLRGRCRYCKHKIGIQYPLVELLTALAVVVSYTFWPLGFELVGAMQFTCWLVLLIGMIALVVYDIRWMLLPNKIIYPLYLIGGLFAVLSLTVSDDILKDLLNLIFALAIGGGMFYVLFHISNGRWIGGGDVKLGFLLALILLTPTKAFLMLLLASILGTLFILPGLAVKAITVKSRIPFGPFLIIAAYLVFLWGDKAINWYQTNVLVLP